MLSENDIKKFQEIYKKEFGKEISKQGALEQGIKLITLMKIVLEQNIKDGVKTNNIDKANNKK